MFQVEPASIDHLKELIANVIASIDQNMLKNVFLNMSRCIKLCKEVGGGHSEHLLYKDLYPFSKFLHFFFLNELPDF